MRPYSRKSSRSNRQAYLFQTKLKSRVSGQSLLAHNSTLDAALDSGGETYPVKNRHIHTEC